MSAPKDYYPSLPALMSELTENEHFIVRTQARRSKVTILSPHGGYIEPGTSAIAEAVAGRTFNFFDFQGLRETNPAELHVTSTRFRHPALEQLLSQSTDAVSIHGMGQEDNWNIWLGGLNLPLKSRMNAALRQAGFSVNTNPPKYKGEGVRNVVNLVPNRGVQLELPDDLTRALFVKGAAFPGPGIKPKTTRLFKRFVTAVRSAVLDELRAR